MESLTATVPRIWASNASSTWVRKTWRGKRLMCALRMLGTQVVGVEVRQP